MTLPERRLRGLVLESIRDPTAMARALAQLEGLFLSTETIERLNGFTRELVALLQRDRYLCRLTTSTAAGTRGLLLVTAVRRMDATQQEP